MMGSVVGIRRQCRAFGCKAVSPDEEAKGPSLSPAAPKVFFKTVASRRDQSTSLPDCGKIRSAADHASATDLFF